MRVIIIPHSPVVRLALVQFGLPYRLYHSLPLIACLASVQYGLTY